MSYSRHPRRRSAAREPTAGSRSSRYLETGALGLTVDVRPAKGRRRPGLVQFGNDATVYAKAACPPYQSLGIDAQYAPLDPPVPLAMTQDLVTRVIG